MKYHNCFPLNEKKTPLSKLFDQNLQDFEEKYKRNQILCILKDVIWGTGTSEPMKKSLSDTPVTNGCALVICNEFNTFIADKDKYSCSKGDIKIYYDIYDGLGLKRNTRIGRKKFVEKKQMCMYQE